MACTRSHLLMLAMDGCVFGVHHTQQAQVWTLRQDGDHYGGVNGAARGGGEEQAERGLGKEVCAQHVMARKVAGASPNCATPSDKTVTNTSSMKPEIFAAIF